MALLGKFISLVGRINPIRGRQQTADNLVISPPASDSGPAALGLSPKSVGCSTVQCSSAVMKDGVHRRRLVRLINNAEIVFQIGHFVFFLVHSETTTKGDILHS